MYSITLWWIQIILSIAHPTKFNNFKSQSPRLWLNLYIIFGIHHLVKYLQRPNLSTFNSAPSFSIWSQWKICSSGGNSNMSGPEVARCIQYATSRKFGQVLGFYLSFSPARNSHLPFCIHPKSNVIRPTGHWVSHTFL